VVLNGAAGVVGNGARVVDGVKVDEEAIEVVGNGAGVVDGAKVVDGAARFVGDGVGVGEDAAGVVGDGAEVVGGGVSNPPNSFLSDEIKYNATFLTFRIESINLCLFRLSIYTLSLNVIDFKSLFTL